MHRSKILFLFIKFYFIFLFFIFSENTFSLVQKLKVAGLLSSKSAEDYICIIKGVVNEAQKKSLDIQFDIFDYHNDISRAVEMSKQIVNQNYNFVIGPRTSQEVLATFDQFKNSNVIQILPIASMQLPDENMTIRMISNSEHYSKLSAKFVSNNLKVNRILIVTNISLPYCVSYKNNFSRFLKQYNWKGQISYIDYIEGSADYSEIYNQAISVKADLIYAPNYAVDIADLYTEFSKHNFKIKILTQGAMYAVQNILAASYNPNVELFFNGIWDLKKRGPHAAQFDDLKQKYCSSEAIPARVATGFDSIYLAIEMFNSYMNKSSTYLKKEPYLKKFDGLLGTRKFDLNNNVILPLHIYKMNTNRFDFYASIQND